LVQVVAQQEILQVLIHFLKHWVAVVVLLGKVTAQAVLVLVELEVGSWEQVLLEHLVLHNLQLKDLQVAPLVPHHQFLAQMQQAAVVLAV
jgi:hypothetical protein